MPKHEAGTPKAIANRMKAKGLQKLRWYCQMCQKQCRDENGFKCHTTSESHQRQLLLFAENPRKYLDSFSKEFADDFVQLLKHRFGTKRVHANQVYQEYIADRHHLHMNATRWLTLTGFVQWLGKTAKCKVDQTEKGWFITYIDRDPDTIKKQEDKEKRKKLDKDDEERLIDFINKQVEKGKEKLEEESEPKFTEFKKSDEEEKIVLTLPVLKLKEPEKSMPAFSAFAIPEKKEKKIKKEDRGEKRKRTALDEIMEEQEQMKEKKNRRQNWLHEGIVVKIITQSLGEKYYKKKGVVQEVRGAFEAIVKVLDSGDVLKLDQVHLETVIPALGRQVKIINGAYRGCTATLLHLHPDKFSCTVKIDAGPLNGREVPDVKYEDVSKVHTV